MKRAVRGVVLGMIAGTWLAIAGCAGQTEAARGQHPIPTAEAIKRASREPKPAELPSLPNGAGEMDADAPMELTPTGTGLYYRILRKGSGRKAGIFNEVSCHYEGKLDDGSVFDSSYRRKEPTRFPMNAVVKGWTEGLQLIEEGGMIELEIPPDLAYGTKGRMMGGKGVPPDATLHFIVELQKVH